MIDSLKIKNFRALEDFEVSKLGRVNLIVGKNNSGKSSVLEALRIYAGNGQRFVLEEIAASHDEKYRIREDEREIESDLPFENFFTNRQFPKDDETAIEIGSMTSENGKLRLQHIFLIEAEETVLDDVTGEKSVRIRRKKLPKSELENVVGQINQALSVSKGGKTYSPILLNSTAMMRGRNIAELFDLMPCGVIPTQFIATDELADEWDKIVFTEDEEIVKRALRIIAPDFENLTFVRNEERGRTGFRRSAKVKLANTPKPVPLNSLGDGMLRVLQLALKLFSAKGGFLLIDEFENGLHYSVQEKVWSLLFEMAQKLDIQIFATTHSWDCIESFSKVATSFENNEGVLFRMGRSAKTSNFGKVVATVFDSAELETITQSDMEIR